MLTTPREKARLLLTFGADRVVLLRTTPELLQLTPAEFFRARITLGPLTLHDVPPDFRLIPGMTSTAEILVGKRTIISYLLDPVIRVFDESLREP